MVPSSELVRSARKRAGLTQTELAQRLGTSQAAVAQLERADANPTIARLEQVLAATGHELRISAESRQPSIDEGQIARHLAMTPAERLASFTAAYRNVRQFVQAIRRPE